MSKVTYGINPKISRYRLMVSVLFVGFLAWSSAEAAPIPLGYISWDVNIPGSFGQFDIVNQTGPNSTYPPDTTFPVTNTVLFSDLSLTVHFTDGTTSVFGPSYFTLNADGESLDGSPIAIGGSLPLPRHGHLNRRSEPDLA